MEQMALNNAIGPYYETTQEFVDELQNYLKVSKVCANDKLEECFGYDKLLLANGEEFELAEIKSGENLGKTADNTEYLETVGLVTIDGTGMIVSWNKKCDILEPKVYPWGGNTNETTSCVAMLMDINLDKSPNRINKDIALFRAESPSKTSCGMEFSVGGTKYCWGVPFIVDTPLLDTDCAQNKSTYGITNCIGSDFSNQDYWGNAMKKCKSEGKRLPSGQELADLATYLYGTNIPYNGETNTYTNATMNTTALSNTSNILASALDSNGLFVLWSGVEASENLVYTRFFDLDNTGYNNYTYGRFYSNRHGVCVGD